MQQVLLEPQQAQLEPQQALQVQLELEQQLGQQELQVLGLLLVLQQEQQQVLLQEQRLLLVRLEQLVLELNIQRLRHHVDR